jgi:hypothetical protein
MRTLTKIFFASFFLCALVLNPAYAQSRDYVAYAWHEGDLALLIPTDAEAQTSITENNVLRLNIAAGETVSFTLMLHPETTTDIEYLRLLQAELSTSNLVITEYQARDWFGRTGLTAIIVSGQQSGFARVGRLPDNRVLMMLGLSLTASTDSFAVVFDHVVNSLVFGADSTPIPPTFRPLWSQPAPETPSNVTALAAGLQRLYTVDIERGVIAHNLTDGTEIAAFPFQNPAQPTALAVDAEGVVYVGDRACRCIRRMLPNGAWLDSLGNFGANAPFDIALVGSTLYATDLTAEGYTLRGFGGAGEQSIELNFNGAAPPLLASSGDEGVYVLEWLASLIDGSTSGAYSVFTSSAKAPELQGWIPIAPDGVRDIALRRQLALAGDSVQFFNEATGEISSIQPPFVPTAVTFDDEGILYIASRSGELAAYSDRLPPERIGDERLRLGVPVQGVLSEANPAQSWAYEGRAGEIISLQAIDLARGDFQALGLDMDITLLAPDGSQVAYNDDQRGDDLFGIYDAHIPDVRLPADGTYTVNVGWRQGEGTYTLGLSRPQVFALEGGVMRLEGRLQDAFPTAHWTFEGRAGQTLTFTMRTESGTLDPALTLYAPDGSLLSFNDDAADPELGVNAQIVRTSLPADGTYTLEAGRFEGVGRFSLVVVEN